MPGIFIGIGGIGGSVVAQVRQALNVHVAFAGETPSALEAARQFRFLLVDTWKDGAAKGFGQAQVFDLPEGKDKYGVDARIDEWFHGHDAAFRSWWPERKGAPWKVGDYAAGAGQLRIKGKLAYRIALTGSGRSVAAAVQEKLRGIDSVLGPAPGVRTVPVYLVCSLGGGTGSGMVLTFAQHLRQALPDYCPLIGVFPLAGITALGPGMADGKSIWANTDAALREIDYCQRAAGTPENALTPFFQWPGDGNVLYGKQRPFQYVYLFGRENQSGQALETFSQYVDLMAETLIAESFSNLIDEGLQTGISGPHSQFVMQLQARPEVGGRATTYASAAVGALVYPAERIERHLARRYAVAVLDRMVQVNRSQVVARVDEFVKQESLIWEGTPRFVSRLTEGVTDKSGRLIPLPPFSPVLDENDETWLKADKDKAAAHADQMRERFNTFVGERYAVHLRKRRTVIVSEYASPESGIRRLVHSIIDSRDPAALGLALAVVNEVARTLERQWTELNLALEGDPNAANPSIGKKKDLVNLQQKWDGQVRGLADEFGSGLRGVFQRNGKGAKQRFADNVWSRLRKSTLDVERLLAGREAYQALLTETGKVERALRELIDQIAVLRDDLERSTRTDVGAHGKTGVLDLAVLDDPRLVAHRFDDLLNDAVATGAEACARAVTSAAEEVDPATVLHDEEPPVEALAVETVAAPRTGIVRAAFDRRTDPKAGGATMLNERFRDDLLAAVVDDGVRLLGQRVRDVSVWDALAAECAAREQLGMHDAALSAAIGAVQADRAAAEQAGVPPKQWEREVLRHFIRNKLFDCQKRVRPFWNLSGLMTANYGHPYHFIVIAADREAYAQAGTVHGIGNVLEDTAALMQAGTPKWLPGRDRIVLYAREGVAPLFYLNDGELKGLRDAAAQKKAEKFLYTDARFEQCADPVIRPQESDEDGLRYAVAVGLQLEVVRRVEGDGRENGARPLRLPDGEEFADVLALDEALRANPVLRRAFVRRVDEGMAAVRAADRDNVVQQALNRAKRFHQEALDHDRPALAQWWKYAEQAIVARMTYGQHLVAV